MSAWRRIPYPLASLSLNIILRCLVANRWREFNAPRSILRRAVILDPLAGAAAVDRRVFPLAKQRPELLRRWRGSLEVR